MPPFDRGEARLMRELTEPEEEERDLFDSKTKNSLSFLDRKFREGIDADNFDGILREGEIKNLEPGALAILEHPEEAKEFLEYLKDTKEDRDKTIKLQLLAQAIHKKLAGEFIGIPVEPEEEKDDLAKAA